MGRIRTVKPGLFSSEDTTSTTIPARYLFIGLFTEADREGRLEYKPRQLGHRLFPGDAVDVEGLLGELQDAGLIQVWDTEDGGRYIAIPTWHKHQKVHPKEPASSIPEPPPWKNTARREKTRPAIHEVISIPSSPVGREGKGREGDLGRVSDTPTRVVGYASRRGNRGPRCGKHINADVLCEAGMCLPEDLAYEFARKLPTNFEDALEQVVTWAESLVPEWHKRVKPDGSDYTFWRNRWSEQFGGSAPSFAQQRATRASAALDEAFNG